MTKKRLGYRHITVIILILLTQALHGAQQQCYTYLQPPHEQYQDIIVNNTVISKGVRECASRYEAIKPILDRYKRPFTVLDIGASQGYFSFRIAHDYPQSICVMIEGNYNTKWQIAEQLLDLCKLNSDLNNIVFLKKCISTDELERLASCEHFDVVLAFNVIHHTGENWNRWITTIFNLGDNIIIETPPAPTKKSKQKNHLTEIENCLVEKRGTILCETPRHTNPKIKAKTFWFQQKEMSLSRSYWLAGSSKRCTYTLNSTFKEKHFIKHLIKEGTTKITQWHPGINVLTFKMLNGAFPTTSELSELLKKTPQLQHPDPFIWNMIIQGKKIELIDWDHPLTPNAEQHQALAYNLAILQLTTPSEIKNFIKKTNHKDFWP